MTDVINNQTITLDNLNRQLADSMDLLKFAQDRVDEENRKLRELSETTKNIRIQRDKAMIALMDETGVIDWKWLLEEFDQSGCHNVTNVKYNARYQRLNSIGLGSCGYDAKTLQCSIQIRLSQKNGVEDVQRTLNGLNEVLPYLTRRNDGAVVIQISENSNEFGQSFLYVCSDRVELRVNYGQKMVIEAKFENLEQSLQYVQEFHNYDTLEDCD